MVKDFKMFYQRGLEFFLHALCVCVCVWGGVSGSVPLLP